MEANFINLNTLRSGSHHLSIYQDDDERLTPARLPTTLSHQIFRSNPYQTFPLSTWGDGLLGCFIRQYMCMALGVLMNMP